jgi:polyketide synthase-associated protein
MGEECCGQLASKGFCMVDLGLDEDLWSKVHSDIREMEDMGKFATPAVVIADALFGQEGSACIAEMDEPGDLSTDGPDIRKVDGVMTDTVDKMNDFLFEMLDLDCRTRTHGLVHETDTAMNDPSTLTEKEASSWLSCFVRSKITVIVCLGPTKGTMELRPFEEEDAEAIEIETVPGTMIIVRSDLIGTDTMRMVRFTCSHVFSWSRGALINVRLIWRQSRCLQQRGRLTIGA